MVNSNINQEYKKVFLGARGAWENQNSPPNKNFTPGLIQILLVLELLLLLVPLLLLLPLFLFPPWR